MVFPHGTICLGKSVPQSVWLSLNAFSVHILLLIICNCFCQFHFCQFCQLVITSSCLKVICSSRSCHVHAEFSGFILFYFVLLLFPVFVSFLTCEVLNVSPYLDLHICCYLFCCNFFLWASTQRDFVPSGSNCFSMFNVLFYLRDYQFCVYVMLY